MKPVFIGGCDRSGTTMLGAMLGAHEENLCIPEAQFKFEMLRLWDWDNIKKPNTLEVIRWLNSSSRFRLLCELDLDLSHVTNTSLSYKESLEWIIKAYVNKSGKTAAQVWVDHSPSNIRHFWNLKNIFPGAKIIHVVRDGRAVASSLMSLEWGPNSIIRAAQFWVEKICQGLAAESCFSKSVRRVRYEDLITTPTDILKELCDWLKMEFQPTMVTGAGFKVPAYIAKQHALVGKKPDPSRLCAWKKHLTAREIEIFESMTGNLLQYLGYEALHGTKARVPTRGEKFQCEVQEITRRIMNKVLFRKRVASSLSSRMKKTRGE